ncbi:hypothetical protein [Prevotella sp. OH937_COT-195]|uniref:hypothetical protein n=1 Tax=Prevotella sp. OH937_COT-195 TaxID=2491051 RepID=UPI0011CFC572|nr:hypothetical protein [Prevotella sp. OH937_COT-195]
MSNIGEIDGKKYKNVDITCREGANKDNHEDLMETWTWEQPLSILIRKEEDKAYQDNLFPTAVELIKSITVTDTPDVFLI